MVVAVRAELRKYFTTRLWWGMAIAVFLAAAIIAVAFALLYTSDSAGTGNGVNGVPKGDALQTANSVYTAGLAIGYLLMLTVGVIQIGAEYRHHTITSTFLAVPHRGRVMGAKVVSLLVIAAMYGVLSLVGTTTLGALTLNARGADPFPSAEVLRTLALSLLVLGLWALIGLGVGILIPNQVAALLIGVGVAWIVEPIAGLAVKASDFGREHIAPFFPSEATGSIVNSVLASPGDVRLEWWQGALTLGAYAAVLAGIGIALTVRRDVS